MDTEQDYRQQNYSSAFNDFFTMDVKPEQVERTMTPSKHKPQDPSKVDKYKLSSKGSLYMCDCSQLLFVYHNICYSI